ncbi:neoverrucotoxin subunit alpha-like [Poeciliopsis prolifica]|nr:neoverrucotoxin subunit alpha-like [Poeciliopsis prolifica]
MDSNCLQIPALGRPFSLGMLYDARKDELMTGISLWDDKFLDDKKETSSKPSSSFQVISSDSLKEKTSLLDVKASLKASFLSGLIEVSGSAKYLNDKKKFKNQSRVTLQYKATTHLTQLLMTQKEASSSGIFSDKVQNLATHVVTGIQYGANAFFVFYSEKLESSQDQEFQGTLEGAINKIPKMSVDGSMSVQLGEKEKSLLKSISCQFYGDFLLDNPTSFEDALKTYQNLSKILREDKNNSVPVEVFLTPLKTYDSNTPAVMGEICEGLITKAQDVFEDLSQFDIRCKEILEDAALKNLPHIYKNVQKFLDLCKKYEKQLRGTIKEKFPLIRAGKENDSSVEKLFDDRNKSAFSHDNLDKWMSDKEAEVTALKICLSAMEGIKIISNEHQLREETFSQDVVHTLCFTFTSLEQALDPYLDQLESSLHLHDRLSFKQVSAPKQNQWYHSNSLIHELRSKAQDLQNMAKGLKANAKFHFLVTALQNPEIQGASIYHYKQGKLVSKNFSKPEFSDVKTIRNKEDLIWYTCDLTLDPNTAYNYIILSEENKKAEYTSTWQYYPDHPVRFTKPQVLCKEGLHGRCYWEVEWSEASNIGVGVAYKLIERNDGFGTTEKSWYFGKSDRFEAWNNGKLWSGEGPAGGCRIIGVYLDLKGGTLSFYKVSCDKLEHLYTFKTTFTDHVYPGFYIYSANNYCRLSPVH